MGHILVVDDDRSVIDMLRDVLGELGHQVDGCRDGKQVLGQLRSQPYDLLVLDILVPHLNGFALIEEIRSDEQLEQLPVVMMSGIYRSRNHRTEMKKRFGVLDYLDKPLGTARLLELVASTIGQGPQPLPAEDSLSFADADDVVIVDGSPEAEQLVDDRTHEEKKQVESDARKSFRPSAFLLQGSIKKMPLPRILGRLWSEQSTGALLLRQDDAKKIIYLRKGTPYLVRSNRIGECLGRVLLKERLITREECEKSVQQMKQTGRRQGELLVEMGCITDRNLAFALELQMEAKLYEPFGWTHGEYRFDPSTELPDQEVPVEWTGPSVVIEGIRRAFDETRLRELMVPVLDVPLGFRNQRVDLSSMRLTSREQQAVESWHLPKKARELLETEALDPEDTLRLLYALVALDIVKPAR